MQLVSLMDSIAAMWLTYRAPVPNLIHKSLTDGTPLILVLTYVPKA